MQLDTVLVRISIEDPLLKLIMHMEALTEKVILVGKLVTVPNEFFPPVKSMYIFSTFYPLATSTNVNDLSYGTTNFELLLIICSIEHAVFGHKDRSTMILN